MSLDGLPPVSRRQLLLGAGAAGVVAVAGCGRDEAGEPTGTGGSPTSDAAAGSGSEDTLFPQPEVRRASQGALATSLTCASETVDVGGRKIAGHTYEGGTPGPTLKLGPGESLQIALVNNLDSSAGGNSMGGGNRGGGMQMGSSAATNLHTHGLHVSPEGNQDNVFLMVEQGQTQDYDIAIPDSHWGGLNWYHPHHHGNVSVQVLGGMQGALIITGPLDEVPEVAAVTEQVLVLQRLQEGPAMIARMSAMHDNAFLSANGNPTFAVNGQVNPRITLRPSEVQRWRLLNADAIDYFDIALVGADGEDVPGALHILAFDGITLPSVRTVSRRRMVPGNRLEVLVQVPDVAGEVQLVGRAVPGFGQPDIVFATVDVAGDPVDSAIPEALPAQLTPIAAEEVQTKRRVQFGSYTNAMSINGVSFDQGPDEMEMVVGSVEEWTIENLSDQDHAFHIHTNPFWVVAEGGVELSEPAYFDTYAIPPASGPDSPGSLTVRFRPTQFTGRIVQHCHILPHEDAGMMGVVTLV